MSSSSAIPPTAPSEPLSRAASAAPAPRLRARAVGRVSPSPARTALSRAQTLVTAATATCEAARAAAAAVAAAHASMCRAFATSSHPVADVLPLASWSGVPRSLCGVCVRDATGDPCGRGKTSRRALRSVAPVSASTSLSTSRSASALASTLLTDPRPNRHAAGRAVRGTMPSEHALIASSTAVYTGARRADAQLRPTVPLRHRSQLLAESRAKLSICRCCPQWLSNPAFGIGSGRQRIGICGDTTTPRISSKSKPVMSMPSAAGRRGQQSLQCIHERRERATGPRRSRIRICASVRCRICTQRPDGRCGSLLHEQPQSPIARQPLASGPNASASAPNPCAAPSLARRAAIAVPAYRAGIGEPFVARLVRVQR